MDKAIKTLWWIAAIVAGILFLIWIDGNSTGSTGGSNLYDSRGVALDSDETDKEVPAWDDYVEKYDPGVVTRDNWDCGDDDICDGHEAGWDWADEHTICDMEYDNTPSFAFNEGVRSWAYENCFLSDLADQYEDEFGVRPADF